MFFLILVLLLSTLVFFLADVAQVAIALASIARVFSRNVWRLVESINGLLHMTYFCCKNPGLAIGVLWAFVSRLFSHTNPSKKKCKAQFKERAQLQSTAPSSDCALKINSINLVDEDGRIVITEQDFDPSMTLGAVLMALNEQGNIFSEEFVLLITYTFDSKTYYKVLSKECLEMAADDILIGAPNTKLDLETASMESLLLHEIDSTPLPYNKIMQVDFFDSGQRPLENLPTGAEDFIRSLMGPINLLSSSQPPRLVQSGMAISFAIRHWARRDKSRGGTMHNVARVKVTGSWVDQEVSLV